MDLSQALAGGFLMAGASATTAAVVPHAAGESRAAAATIGAPQLLTAEEGHKGVCHRSLHQLERGPASRLNINYCCTGFKNNCPGMQGARLLFLLVLHLLAACG